MTAPRMPNPAVMPVAKDGRLTPEWVRYIATLVAYIYTLEARIAELEGP